MRIGFVKRKYVPFGGGELYLERLLAGCRAAGHDVHLLAAEWGAGGAAEWPVEPIRVKGIGRAARLRSFSKQAAAAARRLDLDVLMSLERTAAQDVWRAGEGVHRVWLERRRQWVGRWQCRLEAWTAKHRALLRLEAGAVCRSRLVIANSRMVERDIERVYPERSGRLCVIYNGIDDGRYGIEGRNEQRRRMRAELQLPARRGLLLFVGSGFRRKGLYEMLAALRHLPECELLVFGRDRLRPWQERVRRFRLRGRVRFMQPTAELAPYYHAADVAVLPSWFDPFPNAGLEALRCGTPLVTSRFAGVHELVDPDVNGEVVERPDGIAELTGAIHRQLELSRSHTGRADAIHQSVAAYTMQRNVSATLEALERLRPVSQSGLRPQPKRSEVRCQRSGTCPAT